MASVSTTCALLPPALRLELNADEGDSYACRRPSPFGSATTPTEPSVVWPPTPSPVASYGQGTCTFDGAWAAHASIWPQGPVFQMLSLASAGAPSEQASTEQMVWAPFPLFAGSSASAGSGAGPAAPELAVPQQPPQQPPQLPPITTLGSDQSTGAMLSSNPPSWTPTAHSGAAVTKALSWSATSPQPARQSGDANVVDSAVADVALALQGGACEGASSLPSAGSALHDGMGKCSPCAWFWKPRGCSSGASCDYCHLCPAGELGSRRKEKVKLIRKGLLEPKAAQARRATAPEAGGSSRVASSRASTGRSRGS
jgi:hypothetical protein